MRKLTAPLKNTSLTKGEANEKLTPSQLFAMLICTRAFSMMTFLPESTANALELMLGTVLSTVFR